MREVDNGMNVIMILGDPWDPWTPTIVHLFFAHFPGSSLVMLQEANFFGAVSRRKVLVF
jgi:hypothetical protein